MNSRCLPDLTDPGLLLAAGQVVWWQSPESTLQNERLFLNQAMRHGTPDVVETVRRHYDDDRLRDALRDALPGIFDRRSWAYWHLVLDMGAGPAATDPQDSKRGSGGHAGERVAGGFSKPVGAARAALKHNHAYCN